MKRSAFHALHPVLAGCVWKEYVGSCLKPGGFRQLARAWRLWNKHAGWELVLPDGKGHGALGCVIHARDPARAEHPFRFFVGYDPTLVLPHMKLRDAIHAAEEHIMAMLALSGWCDLQRIFDA